MSNVLRKAYIEVEPNTDGFDVKLKEQIRRKDPGGKAGKLVGTQLNAALRRVDVETIDIKADPKQALLAIAATEDRLKALARDSATVEVKVHTEKALLELRRFKKQLGDVGNVDATDVGGNFFKKFTATLASDFAAAGTSGPIAVSAGLLGAALAPTIAAGIGGAIGAGAGAAVILGGIALVAKDPLVSAYGKQIGQRLLAGLTTQAEPLKKPVLDALAGLDAAAQRALPKIGAAFEKQAPQVRTLTGAITRTGEALLNSLVGASNRSAPALGALGHMVESVGGSLAGFITDVTSNSKAGASGLDDLTLAMSNTVKATGEFIHGLADIKGAFDSFDSGIDKGRNSIEDFFSAASGGRTVFDITADGYKHGTEAANLYSKGVIGAAGSVNDYTAWQKAGASATEKFTGATIAAVPPLKTFDQRMTDAAAATRSFSDAIHKAFSDQMSLDQATLALAEGQKTLRIELQHGERTLKLNSDEGQKNRGAILAQLSAVENLRQARFAETGSLQVANAEYSKNVTALRRAALAANFNKGEVDKLIGSYRKVPGKVTTLIGTPGLPQSDAGIKNYDKKLDALARKINTNITVTGDRIAYAKLKSLLVQQQALKKGISISAATAAFNKNAGDGYGVGYDKGGFTGPGAKLKTAGVVHAGEYVFDAQATSNLGVPRLDKMHESAKRGYDAGGAVLDAPFPVNAGVTRIPSKAEAMSAVTPALPLGGRTSDWIIRIVRAAFPGMQVLSKDRPGARTLSGNTSYHALGRAVDFRASRPLAEFWNAKYMARTKELISPWNDLNIHNGKRHSYTGAIYRQHSGANAHDHIAMGFGGVIAEPVRGIGASGRSYSFGERGPETVTPGVGGGGNTYILNFSGPVASKRAAKAMVLDAVKELKNERKL